jgi:hypothetical protein
MALWAGGAVIFLVLQWLAYRAFARRLDSSARPARPPRYGGIATFVSDAVDGPLALGLTRRRIVIPSDFSRRYSESERRLALEHELTHHRRRDIWWNVAAIIVLALNWFNPLAWLAFRAFRTDQELACDAAVAAGASPEERHDYALALVKSASQPGLIAACSMNNAGELKRRLRMLRSHRASPLRSAGGMAALSLLAVGGLSLATATSEPRRDVIYVASPEAVLASAAPTAAAPAAIAEPQAIRVAATRLQLARALAVHRRVAAPKLAARMRLALADAEPALAPLTLNAIPVPRLRLALPASPAEAAPRAAVLRVTHTRAFLIRVGDDPFVREQVREGLRQAIAHITDPEARDRLERLDRLLAARPYSATVDSDPREEI